MVFYNSVWGFDLRNGWFQGQTAQNRNKHPSSHKMSYWVNNLRLGTYCIAWSNTILLLLYGFQIISSSMYTPTLTHTAWLNGNATWSGGCLGPLHQARMQRKSEWWCKSGRVNLIWGWMESAVIKSTRAVDAYASLHSSVAHRLGSRFSHSFTNTGKC